MDSRLMEWAYLYFNDVDFAKWMDITRPMTLPDCGAYFRIIQDDPKQVLLQVEYVPSKEVIGFVNAQWSGRDILGCNLKVVRPMFVLPALALALDYAFLRMGARKVLCYPPASHAPLFEKVFRRAGIMVEHRFVDGGWVDVAVLELLRREYDEHPFLRKLVR